MKLIEWPYYGADFLLSQGLSPDFVSRFWEQVIISESCWIWNGRITRGYGYLLSGFNHGYVKAHRASWLIHFGPIPDGLCVLHDCPDGDNSRCIRPSHLWLGTRVENVADMNDKGRHGSNSTWMKGRFISITDSEIEEMLLLWNSGITQRELALRFRISKGYVQELCSGRAPRLSGRRRDRPFDSRGRLKAAQGSR